MPLSHHVLAGVAAVLLASCTVAPPPSADAVLAEALPAGTKVPATWASAADPGTVATGWVASLNDARLSALVNEAMANNLELRAAAAQVQVAQAALALAGAPLYPTVGIGMTNTRTRDLGAGIRNESGSQLGVSWELDLWGKLSSGQARALAEYGSAQELDAFARMSVAALVARGWYTNIALSQNIEVARRQVATYERLVGLIHDKNAAGAVGMLEVDQAEATLAAGKAELIGLQARKEEAVRSLEVLLGRYPAAELKAGGFPALPGRVKAGTPASLLSRRPDVRAAGDKVAAAFYGVKQAELALLPAFTLFGSGGKFNSAALGILGLSPNYQQIGLTLLQPIFAGGALNADIAAASARKQEAVANYGQAVLAAFREVENALANENYFRQRYGAIQEEQANWADAVDLAQDQFDQGATSLFDLLLMEERYESAQQQAINARLGIMVNRVDLYLALGGGI